MANETIITIAGNLTADPELRTTQNGGKVANFTVANTARAYNAQTQQWEDGDTIFMRCTAWRTLAENIAQSLTKGTRVIVQGRLQQQTYKAQDGTDRTVFNVQADDVAASVRNATVQVQRAQSKQQAMPPSSYANVDSFGSSSDPWDKAQSNDFDTF